MQREATLASGTDVTSGHQGASSTGGDTLVVNIYPSTATVRGYLTEMVRRVCITEGFGKTIQIARQVDTVIPHHV